MRKDDQASPTSLVDERLARILTSRKYRSVQLPSETLTDLVEQASQSRAAPKEIEKLVRQKLHNIVAPYLGDPDYSLMQEKFAGLPRDLQSPQVRQLCLEVLQAHASTAERIPFLTEFYQKLFAFTGQPRRILDVACGLNPFSLPWMKLENGVEYLAYDLHHPRVMAISAFFSHVGHNGRAVHQDILVTPPSEEADVVFFFKEAHRFEQRQRGCCREFFKALNTRFLLVSLPTESLSGRHPKVDQDRRLIDESIKGQNWQVDEILFPNEIVFCIKKAA